MRKCQARLSAVVELWCWRQHPGGGGSRQAGINILVKKAASVVWQNVNSPEAQAEGEE